MWRPCPAFRSKLRRDYGVQMTTGPLNGLCAPRSSLMRARQPRDPFPEDRAEIAKGPHRLTALPQGLAVL